MPFNNIFSILRDTEASQPLMLDDILPLSGKTYSDSSILIQDGFVKVSMHIVKLNSDLVSGPSLSQ